jgi:hypothetical protein
MTGAAAHHEGHEGGYARQQQVEAAAPLLTAR